METKRAPLRKGQMTPNQMAANVQMALVSKRPPDDPERIAARQEIRASKLEAELMRFVDGVPAPTPEQIRRLRALLPEVDPR